MKPYDPYPDAVLALVEAIPLGRVMTYGLIAEVVADQLHRGGPRVVGRVIACHGSDVPWWRVVNAAGKPPAVHFAEAFRQFAQEGTPLTVRGDRVDLHRAIWFPEHP